MLESQVAPGNLPVVIEPGLLFRITTAITLVSGTMFLMWLGEQVTERGIGNGISLISSLVSLPVCLQPLAAHLSWLVLVS